MMNDSERANLLNIDHIGNQHGIVVELFRDLYAHIDTLERRLADLESH